MDNAVNCADAEGNDIQLPADYVILAVGYRSRGQALSETLSQRNIPFCVIGDAEKARDIQAATTDAYRAFLVPPHEYGVS